MDGAWCRAVHEVQVGAASVGAAAAVGAAGGRRRLQQPQGQAQPPHHLRCALMQAVSLPVLGCFCITLFDTSAAIDVASHDLTSFGVDTVCRVGTSYCAIHISACFRLVLNIQEPVS